jgi:hypothetical protein
LREVDLCFASLVSFIRPSGIARTEADIDHQCNFLLESQECAEDYVDDCIPELMQELVNPMLEKFSSLRFDLCNGTNGTSDLRSKFLKHSECLATMLTEGKPCTNDLTVAFEMVTSNITAGNDRLPLMCCSTGRFKTCLKDIVLEKCGEETWDFVMELKSRFSNRIMDNICEEYTEEHEICLTLPEPGTPVAKRVKGKKMNILNRILGAYGGV